MNKICIISQGAYPLLVKSTNNSPVGGAEVQLVTLGKEFTKKGFETHFLVGDFHQPTESMISDRLYAHKTPLRYLGGPNYFLFLDWLKLLRTLYAIDADIHILKLPNHLLFPIGLFCKIFNKKLLFICQIDRDTDLSILKKHVNVLDYYLYRIGLFFTDHIIAQNDTQRTNLLNFFNKGVSVIKNILSIEHQQISKKERYILWVGSNLPRKRPELLIELAKKCPQIPFKMIMSTSQHNDIKESIQKQCATIPNIEFIAGVPFHSIGSYYQKAAILVSTSELEGFPNVFLHAWQYATPVISLNIDPDHIIEKNKMGLVAVTIEQMAQQIISLSSDDQLRISLGENGKKYIDEHHAPEKIIGEYCDLINSLVKKSR